MISTRDFSCRVCQGERREERVDSYHIEMLGGAIRIILVRCMPGLAGQLDRGHQDNR